MKTFTIVMIGVVIGAGVRIYQTWPTKRCEPIAVFLNQTPTVVGQRCTYTRRDGVTVRERVNIKPKYVALFSSKSGWDDIFNAKPREQPPEVYYIEPEPGLELIDPKAPVRPPVRMEVGHILPKRPL